MSDTATLEKPPSVEDLRSMHLDLLRRWADLTDKQKRKQAEDFRHEAARAGAYIKSLEDRDTVQGLIDYWSGTIASLPTVVQYPEAVLLDDFNTATVQKEHGRCPFVGLNPFSTADAPYYFGRQSDVDALLELLSDNPMAVIAGPSGIGKTSLAQAGIAGRLSNEPGKRRLVGIIRPGRDPIGGLLGAVRPANAPADWMDAERAALATRADRFRELAEAPLEPEQTGLLIVDRAEELFASDVVSGDITVAAAAVAAFVLGSAERKHRVIFTIREDFFEQLNALVKLSGYELPDNAIRRLAPLSLDNLREAIVKPGEQVGFQFDEAVVTDLVHDIVEQPDALPLLEFALTQMWKSADVDRISWSDYQKLPKPCQLLTDVAERVYAQLPSPNGQEVARIALLEMIRVGQDITGRRVRRDELQQVLSAQSVSGKDLNEVLRAFVDAGLLRRIPADTTGDDRFELSHSAVIRHWPRLIVWLQDKRRAEAGQERYVAALERWRANGRSSRYLLSLRALLDSSEYRGASYAVDEYIAASRKYWIRLGAVILGAIIVIASLFAFQSRVLTSAFDRIRLQGIEAQSTAREESAADADLNRQAMIADQTLARAIENGTVPRSDVPAEFLGRLDQSPDRIPAGFKHGYDLHFLDPGNAAEVPMPRFVNDPGRLIQIEYPHVTVIYDAVRKIPLIVASNRSADAAPLKPFPGIGFFKDWRLQADLQSSDRFSPAPEFGRVPIVDWQQVGWTDPASRAEIKGFLNYMPISVLQPWSFYSGLWASIDKRLLATDASRLTVLTGPILTGSEPVVNGTVVPQAYWKVAIRWDSAKNALVSEAYRADLAASRDTTAAQATTTVEAIEKATGLTFGRANTQVAQSAAPRVNTPTVYLQFAGMSGADAFAISSKLTELGYKVPPEERLDSAKGRAEIRYVNPEDKDQADLLKERTETILSDLGYGPVKVEVKPPLTWVKTKPPRGVIELWLGPNPPKGAPAKD
jgi:DNA/RNA endonuclease G (NUC1)